MTEPEVDRRHETDDQGFEHEPDGWVEHTQAQGRPSLDLSSD
jgi:hypothetical protein